MNVIRWIEQCIIVDGYLRSAIYDLNRSNIHLVDKNLGNLVEKIEGKTKIEVLSELTLDELSWYNHIEKLGMLANIPNVCFTNFQKIPLNYISPRIINVASVHENNDLEKAIEILNQLNCFNLTLIIESDKNLEMLLEKHFVKTDLLSLDIFIKKPRYSEQRYKKFINDYPVINEIQSFSTKTSDHQPVFHLTIASFIESLHHNVYFNRRIHVDEDGLISNSPKSIKSTININDGNSLEISQKIEENTIIKSFWNAKKDDTDICKNCEFRYQCYDTRQPLYRDHDKSWYYNTECHYNPYISKWKGEEGYCTLEECGIISNQNNFSISQAELEIINNALWLKEE